MVITYYLWLYDNLYYGWDIFMCYNGHLYTSPDDHRQGVVIPLGLSSHGLQQVTQTPSAAFPSVDLSPPLRLRRKKNHPWPLGGETMGVEGIICALGTAQLL